MPKSRSDAQQVFDAVLNLEYGEAIELEFPLTSAADSFRSSLYRERKNWAESTSSRDQISITRNYCGFPFKLEITKIPGIMSAIVKKANGSKLALPLQDNTPELKPDFQRVKNISEIDRQKDLMRADGISEEEITDYFQDEEENTECSEN